MDESPEALADWARRHVGCEVCLPVNVPALAYALGIARIKFDASLIEQGRLYDAGSERVIDIATDEAPAGDDSLSARQMFTVAHELGHHLLEVRCGRRLATQIGDADVERFCDKFAAEVLLPRQLVRVARRYDPSFVVLERLCRRANVSTATALTALNHWAGWAHSLLRWRRSSGRWVIADDVLPWTFRADVTSASTTSSVLDDLRPGHHAAVLLPLRVRDDRREIKVALVKGHKGVSALFPSSELQ